MAGLRGWLIGRLDAMQDCRDMYRLASWSLLTIVFLMAGPGAGGASAGAELEKSRDGFRLVVPPETVSSILVEYTWKGCCGQPTRQEEVSIDRIDGRWIRRVVTRAGRTADLRQPLGDQGDPGGDQAIKQFVASLADLRPSMGLRTCNNHTDDYPSYDVTVSLKGSRAILLQTTSNCGGHFPWNVTDGEHLFVGFNPALPEAVLRLIGRPSARPIVPPADDARGPGAGELVTADALFEALTNEWERLLVGEDRRLAPRVDFYTWHLVMALAWMDEPGLFARLERLTQSAEAPLEVRRQAARTKDSVIRALARHGARRRFGP